jgi:hypothetical protein
MKKFILFFLFLLYNLTNAQEVISTQGDSFSNSTLGIDYTIGEVAILTLTNSSNILTQGFHQTNLTVLGIDDYDASFQVHIFPNPANRVLNLELLNFEGLNYEIYDMLGRLFLKDKILNSKTFIDVNRLSNGLYLLVLTGENNQKLKTYRIIKN